MQVKIIRGVQSGFLWTQLQKNTCPSCSQILDSQSFVNPLSIPVKQFSQPESGFSKQYIKFLQF